MNIFLLICIVCGFSSLALLLYEAFAKRRHKRIKSSNDDTTIDSPLNPFEGVVRQCCLLTENEKYHYERLKQIVPNSVLLHTQVSFNSFLKCDQIQIRNRYNRGVVDLIITDLDFNVLLIIEVDDDSHTARKVKAKDKLRDEITSGAGIQTIRINDDTTDEMLLNLISPHLPTQGFQPKRKVA